MAWMTKRRLGMRTVRAVRHGICQSQAPTNKKVSSEAQRGVIRAEAPATLREASRPLQFCNRSQKQIRQDISLKKRTTYFFVGPSQATMTVLVYGLQEAAGMQSGHLIFFMDVIHRIDFF